ncbi:MAG: hypothetical protein AVDCRST_MAG20-2552, partial [uncultured Acidimicrobiales bacterium]
APRQPSHPGRPDPRPDPPTPRGARTPRPRPAGRRRPGGRRAHGGRRPRPRRRRGLAGRGVRGRARAGCLPLDPVADVRVPGHAARVRLRRRRQRRLPRRARPLRSLARVPGGAPRRPHPHLRSAGGRAPGPRRRRRPVARDRRGGWPCAHDAPVVPRGLRPRAGGDAARRPGAAALGPAGTGRAAPGGRSGRRRRSRGGGALVGLVQPALRVGRCPPAGGRLAGRLAAAPAPHRPRHRPGGRIARGRAGRSPRVPAVDGERPGGGGDQRRPAVPRHGRSGDDPGRAPRRSTATPDRPRQPAGRDGRDRGPERGRHGRLPVALRSHDDRCAGPAPDGHRPRPPDGVRHVVAGAPAVDRGLRARPRRPPAPRQAAGAPPPGAHRGDGRSCSGRSRPRRRRLPDPHPPRGGARDAAPRAPDPRARAPRRLAAGARCRSGVEAGRRL